MATLAELRAAVAQLLAAPGVQPVLQLNSNTRERAFEAYVFALGVRAVLQAGGVVELRGINTGPNPNPVVFRGSPGMLGSTQQNFCYAACTLNGKTFELHVDVRYEGSSGATHEVDVSICDHNRADSVRFAGAGTFPTSRALLGAFECKFYDSDLGTDLGREFVGLLDDCGNLKIKPAFVTNGHNDALASYFTHNRRPAPFFGVSPTTTQHSDRFVAIVEQALRQWAGVQ
jgi:hypothetical protein